MGRLERIEDKDGTTTWTYDGSGPNEIGALVETLSPTGVRTLYGYEPPLADQNRGLLARITRQVGGLEPLVTQMSYDEFARPLHTTYPNAGSSPLVLEHGYDAFGHEIEIKNAATQASFWQLQAADQGYRIGTVTLGNGVATTRGYDPLTGSLKTIQGIRAGATVQDLEYSYDLAGRLRTRIDRTVSPLAEEFHYDPLHRLVRADPLFSSSIDYAYHSNGDFESRSDVGDYGYDAARLMQAGNTAFDYDARGNVTLREGPDVPGGSQRFTYTAFNLPALAISGTQITDFHYSAGGARAAKVDQAGNLATLYAGTLYERDVRSGSTVEQERLRVYAGGEAIAEIRPGQGGQGDTTRYLHSDVLGSVQAITDGAGDLMQRRSYDPFGVPSTPLGASDVKLGFTGHEHDVETGLINMNGRIQDPKLGRFLQTDPIVASPFSQGLNAYSYALNSPTNLVDPTGLVPQDEDDYLISGRSIGAEPLYAIGAAGVIGAVVGIAQTDFGKAIGKAIGSAATSTPNTLADAAQGPAATVASVGGSAYNYLVASGANPVQGPSFTVQVSRSNAVARSAPVRGATGNDWAPVVESESILAKRVPKARARGKTPFQRAVEDIERDLRVKNYSRAVDRAAEYWGVKDPTHYDRHFGGAAATSVNHRTGAVKVKVGPKGVRSARYLLSTIMHERVHIQQFRTGNWGSGAIGEAVNELEAYDLELREARRLGLTAPEIAAIVNDRAPFFDAVKDTVYEDRIAAGNYQLLPMHR